MKTCFTSVNLTIFHGILSTIHLAQSITQFALIATRPPVFSTITRTGLSSDSIVPPWSPLAVYIVNTDVPKVQVMYFMASFLLITSVSHAIQSYGYYYKKIWHFGLDTVVADSYWWFRSYRIRLCEYSITSTLMIVGIFIISTIVEVYAIILGAICNYSMIIFGYFSEEFRFEGITHNIIPSWLAGLIAGSGPWIVLWMSVFYSGIPINTTAGAIIYSIMGTTMSLFFSFALVSLYYTNKGRLKGYKQLSTKEASKKPEFDTLEEWWYPILSAGAKSILAWLVFYAVYQI
jgi:hypothetical protein